MKQREPSTECKFAMIFGLSLLAIMCLLLPIEPVSAGGPSPSYPTNAELDADIATINASIALKANKADPTFTGDATLANASAANIEVTATFTAKADNLEIYGAAYANASGSQAMANNDFTTIIFDSNERDPDGAYDNATGLYTCPKTGWYALSVVVMYNTGVETAKTYRTYYNIDGTNETLANVTSHATDGLVISGSISIYCTDGQVIKFTGYNTGTSPPALGNDTRFSIRYLGR